MLEAGHEAFHQLPEPTPDDVTMLMALTERDLLLIGMALPCLEVMFIDTGCFHDSSKHLQERLTECLRVQRPEWVAKEVSSEDEQ